MQIFGLLFDLGGCFAFVALNCFGVCSLRCDVLLWLLATGDFATVCVVCGFDLCSAALFCCVCCFGNARCLVSMFVSLGYLWFMFGVWFVGVTGFVYSLTICAFAEYFVCCMLLVLLSGC